ncbi:hypothetical protein TNCV_5072041 [Trichonephila clavipes]|nr:hypothetical protein TNCV_5072041 [Trichonephila clavipes]
MITKPRHIDYLTGTSAHEPQCPRSRKLVGYASASTTAFKRLGHSLEDGRLLAFTNVKKVSRKIVCFHFIGSWTISH